MIDYQATWAGNKMHFAWAFRTRVRVSRISKNNWLASVLQQHQPAEYYGKLPTTSRGIDLLTRGEHLECILWKFRQAGTFSEPINKPLVDEIMDFTDIVYRNYNYVENVHVTGNNEYENMIFIQQFYTPKQWSF